MEVYVLVRNDYYYQEGSTLVRVFSDYETAYAELQKAIIDARSEFEDTDYEEDDFAEGDMSYSIWKSEYYECNHTDIMLYQKTIE